MKISRNCCCAFGCSNTPAKDAKLSFHTFPSAEKHLERRQKWIASVKRKNWTPTKHSVLCSAHFTSDFYRRPPGLKMPAILKPNAIPTVFPAFPSYLQPTQTKQRRAITRRAPSEPMMQESDQPPCSETDNQEQAVRASEAHKPQRKIGRPKVAPEIRIPNLVRKVNTLKHKVRRLDKKARVQKNLLGILQQENKIQSAKLSSIDGCLEELVDNEMKNRCRKTNRKYSEKIKEFALTMYYYSPKAYAYLRSVFKLPNARTLRRWLETVECEPGFLKDVIENMSNRTHVANAYSLVIDSMAIRKQLSLDNSTNKVQGHVTIGDQNKLASEALVFLLVPILGGVRHPIGYFYVDKIDSDVQSQLILQCLNLTAEHNIRIINITCDGAQANIATLNKLGAVIPEKPFFSHSAMESKVFVTLDPVHMLKLARNALGTMRRFRAPDGIVDYCYIEKLHELQEDIGLRLGNKLSKRHMNWKNMKMKVKLAAEILSSSVADAIEYLSKTDASYKNAGPTISFIRKVSCVEWVKKNSWQYD